MGLFSNNKKLCPICGNPTPRLLSTKVEDTPLCKECAGKIYLPDGALNQMSLDEFREYMNFYEGNQELRDTFTETYNYNFGFFDGSILLDVPNRLFRLNGSDKNAIVMSAENLKSFQILEDNEPLYESGNGELICHKSEVPEKINALAPQIAQFAIQQKEYEMLERMEKMNHQNDKDYHPTYHSAPSFDAPLPFRYFYIEFTFEHPYWKEYRKKVGAPDFSTSDPSIDSYLREYKSKTDELHKFATNLMQIISPGAGERTVGGNMNAGTGVPAGGSAADEIQKYKALLDAGAITEEEYAAKKRQLLGI